MHNFMIYAMVMGFITAGCSVAYDWDTKRPVNGKDVVISMLLGWALFPILIIAGIISNLLKKKA